MACDRVNAGPGFPAGVHFIFDSTPHPEEGGPLPPRCPAPASEWSVSPFVKLDFSPSDPFTASGTFAAAGRYWLTVRAKGVSRGETSPINVR
jgi:hypothetical protein